MRKLLILLLAAMTCLTAWAEDTPDLPGMWAVHGLPKNMTFTVRTGPGEEYFVAAAGKAKVSTNGSVLCYGRVDNWLMVCYNTNSGSRVGYMDAADYPDVIQGYQVLCFGAQKYRLPYGLPITDDPQTSQQSLGTVSGEVTLLANATFAGRAEWVYVEGILDNRDGSKVRGFIKKNSFTRAAEPLSCMPDVPSADASITLLEETTLQTPSIPKDCMRALRLADETLAVVYCDEKNTMLSVHDLTGEVLWSQRIFAASEYTALAPVDDGFKASFYHNYQLMSYTYPLGSQEGTFGSEYVSLDGLLEVDSQSAIAQQLSVPVLRAVIVTQIPQGTIVLASFDDGCGLYLLTEDGLRLVERFSGLADICDPADENGRFTLLVCDGGKPVLRTYQIQ